MISSAFTEKQTPVKPRVELLHYESHSAPQRLAVGDVIRCKDFERGFLYSDNRLTVAWPVDSNSHRDYQVEAGKGQYADDASRGTALFLINQISLSTAEGPDDMAYGEHRLGRDVSAIRLSNDFYLLDEEIQFSLDEELSLCRPQSEIEVMGFVQLPVTWNVGNPETTA